MRTGFQSVASKFLHVYGSINAFVTYRQDFEKENLPWVLPDI